MHVTRRKFLFTSLTSTALLGGGWLWKKSHSTIPGKILGASHERGHLLREKKFSTPNKTVKIKIVIVGGGMAGLSAGWKLQKSGIDDFVILELEDEVGGNSSSGSNAVSPYPWGAHYVPLPGVEARAVRELFEELNVIEGYDARGLPKYNELHVCSAPEERLFMLGQWQEGLVPQLGISNKDKEQYEGFFKAMSTYKMAKGSDGKKAFTIPIDLSSQDPTFLNLDTISMEDWMNQQGWDSHPLRWYVNYCCRDDYGCEMKNVSAWAGIHYFASRFTKSSDNEDQEILTWPEGNGWIVKELKKKLQPHIHSRTMAYTIETSSNQTQVDAYDFETGQTKRFECERVIYCAPRFTASHVMHNEPKHPLEGLSYAPWMVANLTLKTIPMSEGAPISWDNVIYEGRSLGYVNANHQSLSRFRDKTVVTYYLPLSANDPMAERKAALQKNHRDWSNIVVEDLKYAHKDIEKNIEELNVWLWGHAMVRPQPNLIWSQRKTWPKQSGNVYFAHSDMSGMSIFEEAQYQGVRAAESIMKSYNHPFKTSL